LNDSVNYIDAKDPFFKFFANGEENIEENNEIEELIKKDLKKYDESIEGYASENYETPSEEPLEDRIGDDYDSSSYLFSDDIDPVYLSDLCYEQELNEPEKNSLN